MPHYDRRNAALGPGVFTLADARGNNPHGTSESADAEGKRRNAGRYETVGQLDRALDARQAVDARARMPALGAPGPAPGAPSDGGLMGLLVVVGLAVAATYVLATRRASGVDEDEDDIVPVVPVAALPAPQPIVVMPPAPAPIVNPAPIVIDVTAEPVRSRRRSRKAKVEPTVVTVTPK